MVEPRTKEEWKKKHPPKPSASSSDSEDRPATDANPKHREDFNSLLGEASRKREPKD
jgi:hypothetical protein